MREHRHGKVNSIYCYIWLWLLLIVIVKPNFKGNCLLIKANAESLAEALRLTRGIVTSYPTKIYRWKTLLSSLSIISRVPLHNPIDRLRFLNRTTKAPTFNRIAWFRKFKKFIPCSISSRLMLLITKSLLVGRNVSELKYIWLLASSRAGILEFDSSTLVFRGANIQWSWKYSLSLNLSIQPGYTNSIKFVRPLLSFVMRNSLEISI